MGRFHYHPDGTTHEHDHDEHDHSHDHQHGDHAHGDHSHHEVGDHSGYETGGLRVDVLQRILGENERTADDNRADFAKHGIRVVNLMSSPGAGKTTLLRETLIRLNGQRRVGIVEGDIETSIDADRLEGLGASISLVNTANGFGGECHLDASMVRSALGRLPLEALDLLIIENVGNLVCPAEFDVGEHLRAMVYSVTEGEEKPLKYPVMFRSADVVVVNKIDLLPYLRFDLQKFYANLHDIHPGVKTIEVSATNGDGLDDWVAWLADATTVEPTRTH